MTPSGVRPTTPNNDFANLVAVRIADEDVAVAGNVDAVGELGHEVGRDLLEEAAFAADDHHGVALKSHSLTISQQSRDFETETQSITIPPECLPEPESRGPTSPFKTTSK